MVQKAKKKSPATPRTSDEEARDPSWIQKGPGKKQAKRRTASQQVQLKSNTTAARTTQQPRSTVVITADIHQPMEITGTTLPTTELPQHSEQQQVQPTSNTTVALTTQQPPSTVITTADIHQAMEITTLPTTELQQQSETVTTPITGQSQLPRTVTTLTTEAVGQAETLHASVDLSQVMNQLARISQQLEQHGYTFCNVQKRLSAIQLRMITLERLIRDRPTSSVAAAPAVFAEPNFGGEHLTEEQRCMLRRRPLVTDDAQWEELEGELVDGGRYGPFFCALVETVKHRVIDGADVHKTANSTLRALVSEAYLAERVTMAG